MLATVACVRKWGVGSYDWLCVVSGGLVAKTGCVL